MKKLLALVMVISLYSCNGNDGQGSDTSSDTTRTDIGGVENVNGNIPDTTDRGATPRGGSNTPPIDSNYADTANKTQR